MDLIFALQETNHTKEGFDWLELVNFPKLSWWKYLVFGGKAMDTPLYHTVLIATHNEKRYQFHMYLFRRNMFRIDIRSSIY